MSEIPEMSEAEFIESIDCSFPYRSRKKWKETIKIGNAISNNAAFMVLYEICNPPASSKVTPEQQFSMLGYWGKNFSHELKRPMIECVKRIINKNYLTADEAITLMKTISSFPGLYNALGIVNNAVDDEFDKIEAVYESIVDKWRI